MSRNNTRREDCGRFDYQCDRNNVQRVFEVAIAEGKQPKDKKCLNGIDIDKSMKASAISTQLMSTYQIDMSHVPTEVIIRWSEIEIPVIKFKVLQLMKMTIESGINPITNEVIDGDESVKLEAFKDFVEYATKGFIIPRLAPYSKLRYDEKQLEILKYVVSYLKEKNDLKYPIEDINFAIRKAILFGNRTRFKQGDIDSDIRAKQILDYQDTGRPIYSINTIKWGNMLER